MKADATALLGTDKPAWLLSQARSAQGVMEYAITEARMVIIDDKLSVETRLVILAMRLTDLDRQNDALEAALGKVSAAMREAEPA